ncbi:hypothetical protein K458DRAFT_372105 [Lentithecium fluviatile CBS 122367]|uniref:Apple domain-containing protein n=1 Tax=Lentithecium fluviatile CBS 122367 TaxID=1168545 RepID=A0A6G1ISM1_9PLEO|nr:hypothetical protein K458DRAFT_372105 [Lentithecium fluviatile CBS 122367]
MKTTILVAAAFAASASARAIEARQVRPTKPAGPPDVEKCGLDAFVGHTSEALLFCSSLLKSGTATQTATVTTGQTTTVKTTTYTTLYPPTSTPIPPTSTPKPPTSTPKPPTSTPKPPTSTPKPPTSTPKPPTSTPPTSTPTPTKPSPTPTPTPTAGCGIVGYTKDTAAYYFDSSGTKNTFAACSAACKADAQCKSFGYGEANCMLFTVDATSNTNYNPMSPYTFYDKSCPAELPVRKNKRQVTISLGIGGPAQISSACSCLITSGPADVTRTTSVTVTSKATATQTVTRTVSLLPDDLP